MGRLDVLLIRAGRRGSPPFSPGSLLRPAILLPALLLADPALPPAARAGAWTEPRGHLYVRTALATIATDERWDANGDRVAFQESGAAIRDTEYRSRELRLYAEYGASDRITAYGSLSYARLRMEQVSVRYETNGAADLLLGGRFRLNRAGAPLSLSGELKVPTGYATDETPALGGGRADFTARCLAGASRGRGYGTAEAGLALRGGSFQNELVYAAEIGVRVAGALSARAVVRGRRALGDPAPDPGTSPIFDPGLASPRLVTLDGVVGVEIARDLALEAGLSRILAGRNALAGTTLELALAWSGAAGRRP